MRITLNIDDNVLFAAKNIPRHKSKTFGSVISELARSGLAENATKSTPEPAAIYGFRPFPKEGRTVSNALINKLRLAGEY